MELTHVPGRFFDARDERASCENERTTVVLETASGVRLAFVQIAGLIARRVICWKQPGHSLARGELMGLIRFGSRVDVILPGCAKILVKVGDRVRGGTTILGEYA